MHIRNKVISCNGKSLSFYSLSCAVMEIRPLEIYNYQNDKMPF